MKSLNQIIPTVLESKNFSESPIESQLFWAMMQNQNFVLMKEKDKPLGAGIFVLPQAKLGRFRADFYLLARAYKIKPQVWPPRFECRLVVECDGKEFHSRPEDIEADSARTSYIEKMGIKVLRFSGSNIRKNPDICVAHIEEFISNNLVEGKLK